MVSPEPLVDNPESVVDSPVVDSPVVAGLDTELSLVLVGSQE